MVLNPCFKCVRFCSKWKANNINYVCLFVCFFPTWDAPLDHLSFFVRVNVVKPRAQSGRKYAVADAGTENKEHKCSSSALRTKARKKRRWLEVIVGSFQRH